MCTRSKYFETICVALLLMFCTSLHTPAQIGSKFPVAPRPEQERMEMLARKLNLGAKRADSERPQTTQSGHGDRATGSYQCFERGCVYYSAGTGAQAVAGMIFTKYVAEGYERGGLGFPVAGERVCVPPPPPSSIFGGRSYTPSTSYQDFEGGSIVIAGGGIVTRLPERVGEGGVCDAPPRSPARPGSGRFRVTINGFSCQRPTFDDATQRDGVDDEVYLLAYASLYDLSTQSNQPGARSRVMGDSNGFSQRIRAGSGRSIFGGNGGFHEGDSFPVGGRPWAHASAPGGDQPPLMVWEGELARGANAVVIVPSIWEADPLASLDTPYLRAIGDLWNDYDFASEVRRSITTRSSMLRRTDRLRRLFDEVRISKDPVGDSKSRPIGMIDRGEYYAVDPYALVVTYDSAMHLATFSSSLGRGVMQLDFRDDDRLRGLYSVYIEVEQLP